MSPVDPGTAAVRPAGVIHDIGYQRYTGVRLGRGYATRSLYVHGVRTAFGFGRSGKAKIFPWVAVGIIGLYAVVDMAARVGTGILPITYLDFPARSYLLALLFVASAAPELVSRDLRSKTLPLYFSRPLRRTDYALAKLAALITAVFAVFAGPMLVVFAGGAFSVHGMSAVWHEFTDFLGGLGVAAIHAVVLATVGLLISSLLGRRMVAAATIVGFFLVTSAVGVAVGQIIGGDLGKNVGHMIGPPTLVEGLKEWLYRYTGTDVTPYGWAYLIITVGLATACTLLLVLRYRKVSA